MTAQASTSSEHSEHTVNKAMLKKAASACFIGNFVEWFDYASYGYLATVIAAVFFSKDDPTSGLLGAFAVFAVSFFIRPLGGILWGTYGDRHGRRNALSLSILIMSFSTFAIALLPSYSMVGLWAPVLLLLVRIVQGFSASGEYAGAASFLTEYAPAHQRGIYACLVPASTATGLLLGSLFAAGLHHFLDTESLQSWGWRIPFVLALPLGFIGRYIRLRLEDTPKFRELEDSHQVVKTPLRELFTEHRRSMLIGFGVACLNAVAFYVILSYMPTYLAEQIHILPSEAFLAETLSLICYVGLIFFSGWISDHVGRKTMLLIAGVLFVVLSVPLFELFGTMGFMGILAAQIVFGAMLTVNDGTLACFLAEIFPTNVRYTGFAFTFNMANAIFGGTAPFICTWLIQITGNKLAPAWYLVAISLVACVAMLAAKETAKKPLQ